MLDLDNDLQWSSSHSYECESEKMNRVNEPLSIDAYLDFLEDLDAFFQRKRFTAMRMFEHRTPSKNVHEDDRVDLVIVAERSNYSGVNKQLPLQGRED